MSSIRRRCRLAAASKGDRTDAGDACHRSTIARRLGIKFHHKRLWNDPVCNVQLGSAEIVDAYNGNHVLAFAGYNAGRVKEWIARHGDPRDPNVNVVGWPNASRSRRRAFACSG
jgi:soluble lytic murein transglycosylase